MNKVMNLSGIWWASDMLLHQKPIPPKKEKIKPSITEAFSDNLDRRLEEIERRETK